MDPSASIGRARQVATSYLLSLSGRIGRSSDGRRGHNGLFEPGPLRAVQKGANLRARGPSSSSVSLNVRTFVGPACLLGREDAREVLQGPREVEAPDRTASCGGVCVGVQ